MQAPIPLQLAGQTLWLSAMRVAYWEEARTLLAADLHFGKTGHFRKSSIPIPQSVFRQDMQRLFDQVQHFQPDRLMILGDMFHSLHNAELEWFGSWRENRANMAITLVKGNHDILSHHHYQKLAIEVVEQTLHAAPFLLTHEPDLKAGASTWTIAGHVHPGVQLQGLGKQSARFPCFHLHQRQLMLPAFSDFSGLHCVRPKRNDQIFAIVPGSNGVANASLIQIQ